jgi:hypothetical protein
MVAPMVREHLRMSDPLSSDEHAGDPTPSMFERAADVHDLLPPVRQADDLVKLHTEWIRISMPPAGQSTALWPRLTRAVRRVVKRGPGPVDREMIADLIRAIDAVAARCDVIADRLDHQNIVVNDAVTIFGEELTRLRVESAVAVGDAARPSPSPSTPDE